MSDWNGVERRVGDELGHFSRLLKEYTDDEMERYNDLIDKIDQNENKLAYIESKVDEASVRVQNLSTSVTAFMDSHGEFIRSIKRAFPKDEDGHPDYDGHRGAHLSWIKNSEEEKDFKNYVKKVVTGAVAIGVVSWLWAVVWPAFVMGGHR